MSFDDRWARLARAARQAPGAPLPPAPQRRWPLPRCERARAGWIERAAAATGLGLLAAGWTGAVLLGDGLALPDTAPSPSRALPSLAAPDVAGQARALGLPPPPLPRPRELIVAAATFIPFDGWRDAPAATASDPDRTRQP